MFPATSSLPSLRPLFPAASTPPTHDYSAGRALSISSHDASTPSASYPTPGEPAAHLVPPHSSNYSAYNTSSGSYGYVDSSHSTQQELLSGYSAATPLQSTRQTLRYDTPMYEGVRGSVGGAVGGSSTKELRSSPYVVTPFVHASLAEDTFSQLLYNGKKAKRATPSTCAPGSAEDWELEDLSPGTATEAGYGGSGAYGSVGGGVAGGTRRAEAHEGKQRCGD